MRNRQTTVNVQAKTLDLAIKNAASNLGVDTDSVDYELISKTEPGFLSFLGGRKVEIKAWSKQNRGSRKQPGKPRASNSRQESSPRQPAAELSESESKQLVEDLRDFCAGICKFISGEEVSVEATLEDERLILNIDDEELATQISKNSRLAESMEHILRKKPRYLKRELPFRIFVDARGLRADRENELVTMARDLSFKVAENQRPIVLNYKSSYDRKIIHMALDKDDRVYTKSIGTGANRKLMILPTKDQEGAFEEHHS